MLKFALTTRSALDHHAGMPLSLEQLLHHFAHYRGVTSGYPFGPDALVFKVGDKMFGLVAEDSDPIAVSLKCDPDLALELRAQYPAVTPGYHMNKKHWNTLVADGSIPSDEILELIDHSYQLVVAGLPRAERDRLAGGADDLPGTQPLTTE